MSGMFRRLAPVFSLLVIGMLMLTACVPSAAVGPATPAPPSGGGRSVLTPTAQPPGAAPTSPAAGATTGQAAATPGNPASEATAGPATGPSITTARNPDTFVEATYGSPESLDPAWAYDTASGEVILNVYQTLLFPKKDSATDFVPMLASKWDISQDGKTYTFTIRKGVKFQDGQDLTPEDVAYSFWRGMIQDRSGGPQWILLQPFFGLDVQSFKKG